MLLFLCFRTVHLHNQQNLCLNMALKVPSATPNFVRKRRRSSTGSTVSGSDGEADLEQEQQEQLHRSTWQNLEDGLLKLPPALLPTNSRYITQVNDEIYHHGHCHFNSNGDFNNDLQDLMSHQIQNNADMLNGLLCDDINDAEMLDVGEPEYISSPTGFQGDLLNNPDALIVDYDVVLADIDDYIAKSIEGPTPEVNITKRIQKSESKKDRYGSIESHPPATAPAIVDSPSYLQLGKKRAKTTHVDNSIDINGKRRGVSDYANLCGKLRFSSDIFNDTIFKKTELPMSRLDKMLQQVLRSIVRLNDKDYIAKSIRLRVLHHVIPPNLELINERSGCSFRGISVSQKWGNRSYQPGEVVHSFKPHISVLHNMADVLYTENQKQELLCNRCMTFIPDPMLQDTKLICPACNLVWYCSFDCLKNDTNHYIECQYAQSGRKLQMGTHCPPSLSNSNSITATERVALQLMYMISSDDMLSRQISILTSHHELICEQEYQSDTESKSSDALHCSDNRGNTLSLLQQEVTKLALNYVSKFQRFLLVDTGLDVSSRGCSRGGTANRTKKEKILFEALLKIIYIILVNATVLQNYYNEDIGVMFDPFFALINHSCIPNCILVFENETVHLRALNVINPGDQLFVNYCPISLPSPMRRVILKRNFFFDCTCPLCTHPFDCWLPVLCPNCKKTIGGFQLDDTLLKYQTGINDNFQDCHFCGWKRVDFAQIGFNYSLIINYLKCIYSPRNSDYTPFEITLTDLSYATSSDYILDDREKELFMGLFKTITDCESIPIYSWPSIVLAGSLSRWYKAKYPKPQLNQLRFTVIELIATELLDTSEFKSSMGMHLFEILLVYLPFLGKVLDNKSIIEDESNELNGKVFSFDDKYALAYTGIVLTIQASKYIKMRYTNHVMVPMLFELQMIALNINELVIGYEVSAFPIDIICDIDAKMSLAKVWKLLGLLPICGELCFHNGMVLDTYLPIEQTDLEFFNMMLSN